MFVKYEQFDDFDIKLVIWSLKAGKILKTYDY